MGEHEGPLPPAGWLDDPEAPGEQRWWDGQAWTEHRRHPDGAPPPPAPIASGDGGPAHEPPPSWAAGSATAPVSSELNPLAVASLVASLVWLGGFSSLAGIVLGVLARRQIDESGGRQRGEGLATAGIVIGILGFVLPIVLAIGGALFFLPWGFA